MKKLGTGCLVLIALFVLVVVVVIVVAALIGGGSSSSGGTTKVTYTVTGTAKTADMTYSNGLSTSQENDRRVPWTKHLTVKDDSLPTYNLIAQNKGAHGRINCSITVNGKQIAHNTSTGAYAVATCDAS